MATKNEIMLNSLKKRYDWAGNGIELRLDYEGRIIACFHNGILMDELCHLPTPRGGNYYWENLDGFTGKLYKI